MRRCLGRVPSRHDPRTLRLARYLRATRVTAPPLARDWTREVDRFGMFANDRIGDCGLASIGHILQAQSAAVGDPMTVAEPDIVDAYRAVGNYDPAFPDSDQGVQMIDVLRYGRRSGIAGIKFDGYVRLDEANRLHAELAVNLFGAAYLGIDLPRSAQHQTMWDVAPPGTRDPAYDRNSWGGHAVAMVGYSRTAVIVVTWGQIKLLTWEFFYSYVSEAWAILTPVWMRDDALTPSGFDRAQLDADLIALDVTRV